MWYKITFQMSLMIAFCLTIGGCVQHTDRLKPNPDIFWPNPPEVKRIAFVNTISKPEDLKIHQGIVKQFVNYMVGEPEVSIVSPYGISTDSQGRLFVVDSFLKRIHVFDVNGNRYFSFPSDRTMLVSPIGIAVDKNGRIYITDSKKAMVYIFKDQGKTFVATLGNDLFTRPTGIAVNWKTMELLVVDTRQSKVFRFDLSSLKQKGSFGGSGGTDGRFHYPTHISVTMTGSILVCDSLNFRVQVFSPEGRFLSKIDGMGHVPGTFSRPKGVASDSDGNIYVIDALFDNIQVFDTYGRLLMAFGEHGNGIGGFWLPTGIYIDQTDLIYVSDSGNQRVQMFQYLKKDLAKR